MSRGVVCSGAFLLMPFLFFRSRVVDPAIRGRRSEIDFLTVRYDSLGGSRRPYVDGVSYKQK